MSILSTLPIGLPVKSGQLETGRVVPPDLLASLKVV